MVTGIRERTIIRQGGRIELSKIDLPEGTHVEVIVLVDDEMDTTEYLLSSEANREYFDEALKELKHPDKFVEVDIENL